MTTPVKPGEGKMERTKQPRLKPAGRWLDIEGVRLRLKKAVEGNAAAWAKAHGISPAYVSDVLNQRRLPGDKITKALGLEKAMLWRTPKRTAQHDNASEAWGGENMSGQTELAKRALARADADGLPADHPLRDLASKFNAAATGFYSEPQTVTVQSFMGAWARFRRAWCNYTGEPLI